MEDVKKEIEELRALVDKQRVMLAKTAQQVVQLQVRETKREVAAIPAPADVGGVSGLETADFATNEDLVQLVGELQGQLTLLEDKAIARTKNSHVSLDTDVLEALPNLDGTFPADFPANVAEFRALGDDSIVELARFYELVAPSVEEQAKWDLYLSGKSDSAELKQDEALMGAEGLDESTVEGLWGELAIFLGVNHLKRDI